MSRGIPVVLVCSEPFAQAAAAHARMAGYAEVPTVAIPHPVGTLPPAEARERGRSVAEAVIRLLTTSE